jgi:hypothetical protein
LLTLSPSPPNPSPYASFPPHPDPLRAVPLAPQLGDLTPSAASAPDASGDGDFGGFGGGDFLSGTMASLGLGSGHTPAQQAWLDALPKLGFLASERLTVPLSPPQPDERTRAALARLLQ